MAAGPFAVNDVILRIAGRKVASRGDLYATLRRDLIGHPAPVEVWRDGRVEVVECKPGRLEKTT